MVIGFWLPNNASLSVGIPLPISENAKRDAIEIFVPPADIFDQLWDGVKAFEGNASVNLRDNNQLETNWPKPNEAGGPPVAWEGAVVSKTVAAKWFSESQLQQQDPLTNSILVVRTAERRTPQTTELSLWLVGVRYPVRVNWKMFCPLTPNVNDHENVLFLQEQLPGDYTNIPEDEMPFAGVLPPFLHQRRPNRFTAFYPSHWLKDPTAGGLLTPDLRLEVLTIPRIEGFARGRWFLQGIWALDPDTVDRYSD